MSIRVYSWFHFLMFSWARFAEFKFLYNKILMIYSDNNQSKKSLKFSFLDGIFASGMFGLTQDFFTPFLLVLNASVRHVGALNALPNFVAAFVQIKSADFCEKLKSRRKIINLFVFLQAVMLLPIMALALSGRPKPVFFIILATLFVSFGAFAGPAWGSLMSDLVPENKRGEYFGWRNRILGIITVGVSFIAGFILHIMKKFNIFYGFAIIFGTAFICRIISWYFLTKMHEVPVNYNKENCFTLWDFLARIKESNFAKFVLFVSVMNFSINLCSPFFAVMMLRELSFGYFKYIIITITATLTVFIMISRWGRLADKVGNLKIIKFTAPLIGILPLFWIINRHPVFLFFVQIFAGFVWAGFNICASNFIYDAVSPAKRTRCIAYFNMFSGIALCFGALTGGFIVEKLPPIFNYKILTLFLISSVLRIASGLLLPSKLKEVRPVEKINNNQLFFSMLGIKPILGAERKTIRI